LAGRPAAEERRGEIDNLYSAEEEFVDEGSATPEAGMSKAEDVTQVLALLEQMNHREAAVLRLRFGLAGAEPMTLNHVGARLNLTRERVRQIEVAALAKLRDWTVPDALAGRPAAEERRGESPLRTLGCIRVWNRSFGR
jgi:RNA polymerase sigma factor (sigma-70 family)